MDKVIGFLKGIPKRNRADWARAHDMDPVVISQIVGGHKGIGLQYAARIIKGSGGALVLDDFIEKRDAQASADSKQAA